MRFVATVLGAGVGKPQIRSAKLEKLALRLYEKLGSGNAVAHRLGVAPSTAYRMLADAGVNVPARDEPKPRRLKLSPDEARRLVGFYVAGASKSDLEAEFKISDHTIREYVRRAGVELRTVGGRKREFSSADIDEMVSMSTVDGMTRGQIAAHFGSSLSAVNRNLATRGFAAVGKAVGERHGSWRGGLTRTADGYIKQKLSINDPLRCMVGRNGYVPQHRLVMARALGRPLAKHETVHHINGDRGDNNLSNLQLRSGKHGKGMRFVCACCGSDNVVAKEIA